MNERGRPNCSCFISVNVSTDSKVSEISRISCYVCFRPICCWETAVHLTIGVSVYQAYRYSINNIFKTLSLVIASFPLHFRRFVPFKVVYFLPTCISPYFIIMYEAYSVYKKF